MDAGLAGDQPHDAEGEGAERQARDVEGDVVQERATRAACYGGPILAQYYYYGY